MSEVLQVANLRKSFTSAGKVLTAVNDLSFAVKQGECFGLLGPNGAGKSTTMKMLLGLTPADSGSISLLGFSIPMSAREARYQVGVVPQSDALDPDFSVVENLRIYAGYFGISHATIQKRIPDLLDFAQLSSKKDANIKELSGGMKRRLTIARALVNDPQVLVLDEPTTGLDPQARHLIWDRLKNLLTRGKTIVMTTHFMDEAERLCDRLLIVDHGKKIAEDSPRHLIENEISPAVIELVGDELNEWFSINEPKLLAKAAQGYKLERFGDTGYLYCNDTSATLRDLETFAPLKNLRAIPRPANLEDVFLKLTGRDLRD
jgi:lipooligosaccharide transport system ATP-binding protein